MVAGAGEGANRGRQGRGIAFGSDVVRYAGIGDAGAFMARRSRGLRGLISACSGDFHRPPGQIRGNSETWKGKKKRNRMDLSHL